MEAASKHRSIGKTELGWIPVPPLKEINEDPQFEATTIPKEDFERLRIEAFESAR